MRRGLVALLLGVALAVAGAWLQWRTGVATLDPAALPLRARATVAGVEDGDTFVAIVPPHGRIRVRLHAIDTPERVQPFGAEATDGLRALIADRPVQLDCYKRDPRGRAICRVAVEAGGQWQDVGLTLVERGLAWHYRAFMSEQTAEEQSALAAAESRAREQGRGLWRQPRPMSPWECRERLRRAEACG